MATPIRADISWAKRFWSNDVLIAVGGLGSSPVAVHVQIRQSALVGAFANEANSWERVDWRMLYNGNITLFHGLDHLSTTVDWLSTNGYEVLDLDTAGWVSTQDALVAVAQAFGFPDEFNGVSLDAFADILSNIVVFEYRPNPETTGTALVLRQYDAFVQRQPESAIALLDIFADTARGAMLVGHRLMCLVQSDNPEVELPRVGAEAIIWNQAETFRWNRVPGVTTPW